MNTDKELMQQALMALEEGLTSNQWRDLITALRERLAQPEQKPVAWPCLIDSADFSKNTVTLVMQCEDYKVSADTHWLSITPPQRKPLTNEEIERACVPLGAAMLSFTEVARAIEAAHGIGEKPDAA